MNKKINAMIFLQKYAATSIFIFDQINKIQEQNNKISFSVIVTIETETPNDFRPYCICMTYEPYDSDNGKIDVLTEISRDSWPTYATTENGGKIIKSSRLCNFQCRRTFKLDVKDKEYYGQGNYAILLVNATAEDIDEDLSKVFSKQVSNVCFQVISEKKN